MFGPIKLPPLSPATRTAIREVLKDSAERINDFKSRGFDVMPLFKIMSEFGLEKGARILEIAPSVFAEFSMISCLLGYHYIGVDIDSVRLEENHSAFARVYKEGIKDAGGSMWPMPSDIFKVEAGSNIFDAVICCHLFETLENKDVDILLAKMFTWVKKKGSLLIEPVNLQNGYKYFPKPYFTVQYITDKAEENGLNIRFIESIFTAYTRYHAALFKVS